MTNGGFCKEPAVFFAGEKEKLAGLV